MCAKDTRSTPWCLQFAKTLTGRPVDSANGCRRWQLTWLPTLHRGYAVSHRSTVRRVVTVLLSLGAVLGVADPAAAVNAPGGGSPTAWATSRSADGKLVRWNPCAPIPYWVNPSGMPPAGMAEVEESLRRVSAESGVAFRYAGTQRTVPKPGYVGPANGLLFAWGTPALNKGVLNANEAGVAQSGLKVHRDNTIEVVSGYVLINSEFARMYRQPTGFGTRMPSGFILMHELGHIMGLEHVYTDRWQVMNTYSRLTNSIWGAGDRAGLRALGRAGGCIKNSLRK